MEYTSDKNALYDYFKKEPVLFAYHIGDLDDFYFDHCRWAVARDGNNRIDEAILIYRGPSIPTVLAFGMSDNFGRLLHEIIPELPERFYCHHQREFSAVFEKHYERKPLGTHYKMKYSGRSVSVPEIDSKKISRLGSDRTDDLLEFYKLAFPGSYFDPRMLETGKYYGWIDDGKIVSVCGIHVYSGEYRVAALGNIATAPEFRGRGMATAVTGQLTRELAVEGNSISLNVKTDNVPAIRCYEKIGFEIAYRFEESVFSRKGV